MAITRSHIPKKRAGTPPTPSKEPPYSLRNRVRDRPGAAISKPLRPSRGEKKRAPRPSAQLRDELENAAVSGVAARRHEESPRFLFVPYPDVQDIDEETHLAIDASNISERFLARYPMYNAQNMAMIQRELGKGFATYGMTCTKPYVALPIVHQGVATFQHLSHSFNRDVTFRSWDWLQAQLKMVNTRPKRSPAAKLADPQSFKPSTHPRKAQQDAIFSDPQIPCIIYLHWTLDPGPALSSLNTIYNTIATLQASRPTVPFRAFPRQSELSREASKIPDIRALDLLALTGPPAYSYRPQTCFTHSEPTHDRAHCPLRGHAQIIMKRSHSCGGQHVECITGDAALPRHLSTSPSPSPSPPTDHPPTWFAQSHEPAFTLFGEFRIFITTSPSTHPTAIRARTPRIIHTVITEWVDADTDPGAMFARAASAQDFTDASVRPLTKGDLEGFALHVYEGLRGRGDWEEGYESVEMGVRLDVGVGVVGGKKGRKGGMKSGGEKRFFVNEITRFYGADFFAQHTLGAPQQEVCWAFAEAVDGYFGGVKGEEGEK